jgi:hypothetical protein
MRDTHKYMEAMTAFPRPLDNTTVQANNISMDSANSLCPFCNAVLPALGSAPSAERLPCPRCGEPVPAARWRVETGVREGPPPAAPAPPAGPVPGIHNTMRVVVGVMIVMAIVGLSYALWTVQLRRARDPKGSLDPVKFRRPLELEGLGLLPKDNDIVVGLHIAEWLEDKAVGQPLLEEPQPAELAWFVRQITRTTAMELKEIDHIVLGLSFEAQQLTAVVKTRRPMVGERIAEHQPAKSALYQKSPLYEFELQPFGGALVWWIDPKTAIHTIRLAMPTVEHIKGLAATARPIEDVLAPPLHAAVKERLTKYQFAWAVGRLDRLGAVKDLARFIPAAKLPMNAAKNLRTFAFGLEPVEGVTCTGSFHVQDAKAAASLEKLLDGLTMPDALARKVDVPPAEVKEQWVTWQVRGDAAAMRAWLTSAKESKK